MKWASGQVVPKLRADPAFDPGSNSSSQPHLGSGLGQSLGHVGYPSSEVQGEEPPSYVCWFISPMNIVELHSSPAENYVVHQVLSQLGYRFGGLTLYIVLIPSHRTSCNWRNLKCFWFAGFRKWCKWWCQKIDQVSGGKSIYKWMMTGGTPISGFQDTSISSHSRPTKFIFLGSHQFMAQLLHCYRSAYI